MSQILSPGTSVSSTNKSDCHDIAEILLKVAIKTINHQPPNICMNINPPRTIALRSIELITCTVKPVLKGQLLDKEKVVL